MRREPVCYSMHQQLVQRFRGSSALEHRGENKWRGWQKLLSYRNVLKPFDGWLIEKMQETSSVSGSPVSLGLIVLIISIIAYSVPDLTRPTRFFFELTIPAFA